MICELTNKLIGYIYWIVEYGDERIDDVEPDTEVSVAGFVAAVISVFTLSILFVWWWIPSVWVRHNILGRASNVLHKKRFKCER